MLKIHKYMLHAFGSMLFFRFRVANLICSSGFFARENHLFYRFRTIFRVRYVIRSWYESCVRLISPSNLVMCSRTRVRSASTQVVFVPYSESFRHQCVINRLLSSKIHIRDSREIFYSICQSIQINW